MECRWQVEIDPYAQRVLAKHWPNVRRWDDVRTWPQADTERVDCIIGGFPCQDISYAGRGAGLDGECSGLFFEAIRVVRQLQPRYVLLENVAALLSRGLDRVVGELAQIGYDSEWHCLPAGAFGAPHIRDRVFVLGYSRLYDKFDVSGIQRSGTKFNESRQSSSLFADPNGTGREGTDNNEKSPERIQRVGSEFRPNVADASSQRQPRPGEPVSPKRSATEENRKTIITGAVSISHQWATEPAVCRISDEFSEGLDETGGLKPESHDTMGVQDTQERNSHADAKKTRPDQALPIMQKTVASQEIQRATGRPDGISAAEVLRSKVHGGGNDARRTSAGSTEETSGQVQREPLRTLRDSGRFTHPPHGYEPSEQRAIEPENALRIMSHIMALDARQPQEFSGEAAATVQRLRQGICEAKTGDVPETLSEVQEIWRSTSDQEKTWFIIRVSSGNPWCSEWPGVPRVATGIPNRIDRLRGLGNAVVPAVAEWIGKQIVAEKAKHDGSDRN